MPFLISVYRMMYALRKPDSAQAVKELIELRRTSLPPLSWLAYLSTAFLIPSATPMAAVVAIV